MMMRVKKWGVLAVLAAATLAAWKMHTDRVRRDAEVWASVTDEI